MCYLCISDWFLAGCAICHDKTVISVSKGPNRYCDSVCVEVLRPSQPNGVMSSMVSLPNLGRLSPLSG